MNILEAILVWLSSLIQTALNAVQAPKPMVQAGRPAPESSRTAPAPAGQVNGPAWLHKQGLHRISDYVWEEDGVRWTVVSKDFWPCLFKVATAPEGAVVPTIVEGTEAYRWTSDHIGGAWLPRNKYKYPAKNVADRIQDAWCQAIINDNALKAIRALR